MTPYEFHNDKLGLKIGYILSDSFILEGSLGLMTYEALAKRRIRGKAKSEFLELRRGCTNNPQPLLVWQSVPQWIKDLVIEKFGKPQEANKLTLLEQHYSRDAKAFDFYSTHKKANGEFLDDKLIEEYTNNASVLNAMHAVLTDRIGLKKALNGKTTGIHADMVRVIASYKDKWNHTLPCSERLIRFYYKPYIQEGYSALISGKLDNSNSRKVDSFIVKFLNNLFAGQQHKPTMKDVATTYKAFLGGYYEDVVNASTGEPYDYKDKRFKELSHSTITNYLREWENRIGTYSRRGDNHRTTQLFKPAHKFNKAIYAGSIISIDDRQTPFYYDENKNRVWWYNAIDLASGCWTACVHGKDKKGLILNFYRKLVRNYHEWGVHLPYELEAEMSLNSSFQDTFLKPGVMFSSVKLEANNARGKAIEREYGTLRYEFENELEGWVARPFARLESQQKPNEDYGGKIKPIPYNTIVDNMENIFTTINNMPHKTKPEMTRWEYFMSMQNPELRPTNYRGFLPYIGYKRETSCKNGKILLHNRECWLGENGKVMAGPNLINALKQVADMELDVYFLDDNYGNILKALVYLRNTDQYVCEAVEIPTYARATIERTPQDEANMDIQRKYVSTVTGFMKSQRKSIDRIVILGEVSKTLNNKFQMPGKAKAAYVPSDDEAQVIDDTETDDFELPSDTYKSSLLNRF